MKTSIVADYINSTEEGSRVRRKSAKAIKRFRLLVKEDLAQAQNDLKQAKDDLEAGTSSFKHLVDHFIDAIDHCSPHWGGQEYRHFSDPPTAIGVSAAKAIASLKRFGAKGISSTFLATPFNVQLGVRKDRALQYGLQPSRRSFKEGRLFSSAMKINTYTQFAAASNLKFGSPEMFSVLQNSARLQCRRAR
jgi:hypothetical protein